MAYTELKLNYLLETKEKIREAIEAKGQAVADKDTFRSYAEKIAAISGGSSGGGGSVEGVHFVTFMSEDGTQELYKRPVADGDDCADPVKRGLMDEPEKESTAQYNYTHVGWSATPNGALDENILKAVKADKTVYANFAAVLRYYTVTYYDSNGTTVLKTESLAYGTMPSYVAEKNGYNFDGWSPTLTAVTGNASYVAQFSEKITFAGASWADIAEISASGKASETFAVGDTKSIAFAKDDGTTETIKVAIAGFNHDDLADGSGKAGISIVCTTLPTLTCIAGKGYYDASSLKQNIENCKNKLPSELQSVIKNVVKVCDKSYSSGTLTTKDVNCYLWALSLTEMGLPAEATKYAVLGSRYSYFTTEPTWNATVTSTKGYPRLINASGTYVEYWVRQKVHVGADNTIYISSDYETFAKNVQSTNLDTMEKSICFGFCI